MKIQHILVVCVSNICRSSMTEYFLKRYTCICRLNFQVPLV
ncbi:hypothetical protein [Acinetobacter terrae]